MITYVNKSRTKMIHLDVSLVQTAFFHRKKKISSFCDKIGTNVFLPNFSSQTPS